MYTWLGNLRIDYGDFADLHEFATIDRNNFPVLRVFATPQRAVAKVIDLLLHSGWIAGADAGVQLETANQLRERALKNFAVLPLPLVTIYRQDPILNPADGGAPKVFRKQCFDPATGEWQSHPWPGSYETTYEVTFWSIKHYTEVFFREWVYSQLGLKGRTDNETLIPVIHDYPWGTINQRLVFEGSSDESELEGEDPRYLRYTFTFRLRTWHFRKPEAVQGISSPGAANGKIGFVHDLNVTEHVLLHETGGGVDWTSEDFPAGSPAIKPLSLNMFSVFLASNFIATQWPKTGAAKIRLGSIAPAGTSAPSTLHIEVQAPGDEVLISNRVVPLDDDGHAIVLFRAYYKATAPVELVLASDDPQTAPVVWVPNRRVALPATYPWKLVSWFGLMSQSVYSLTLAGTGSADVAAVHLSDIRLHHVRTLSKTLPVASTPGGGQTVHDFTVSSAPHLAVVVFAPGAAPASIDIDGVSYAVDPSEEVGLVALFTPTSAAVSITVPDAVSVTEVYVQPYQGFWEGTDV